MSPKSNPTRTKKHPQIMLTYAGRSMSLLAWSRLLGIPQSTLYARYRRDPSRSHAEILGVVNEHLTWRGHRIVDFLHEENTDRYYDTLNPSPAHGHPDGQERPCPHCGLVAEPWPADQEDMVPDPCLGYLPGVRGACCGHGQRHPFVVAIDGTRLEGNAALTFFHHCGCTACPHPAGV